MGAAAAAASADQGCSHWRGLMQAGQHVGQSSLQLCLAVMKPQVWQESGVDVVGVYSKLCSVAV